MFTENHSDGLHSAKSESGAVELDSCQRIGFADEIGFVTYLKNLQLIKNFVYFCLLIPILVSFW